MELLPNAERDEEAIRARLRGYNAGFMRPGRDYGLHIEENGEIVAGISAGAVCDTLEVDFLYVEEAYRGRGLGRELLRAVEEAARRDGLSRVLLNTYSFQAPGFYLALGYAEAARLSPCFGGYSQHFFVKDLRAAP